jgi:tRNA G37 N-methylase Trm5
VVEFGSGYGTFTLPLAKKTSGTIYALDIEDELVTRLQHKASANRLFNIHAQSRDFVSQGTGLPDQSVDHAMAYNILHIDHTPFLYSRKRSGY